MSEGNDPYGEDRFVKFEPGWLMGVFERNRRIAPIIKNPEAAADRIEHLEQQRDNARGLAVALEQGVAELTRQRDVLDSALYDLKTRHREREAEAAALREALILQSEYEDLEGNPICFCDAWNEDVSPEAQHHGSWCRSAVAALAPTAAAQHLAADTALREENDRLREALLGLTKHAVVQDYGSCWCDEVSQNGPGDHHDPACLRANKAVMTQDAAARPTQEEER